jgi:uncharacterized membrane protein YeaQ/YmgE (transglycosylase-associated protein family)
MSMGLILFVIFGFIVGLIARALMPGRDPMGWIATTLLGVLGSLLGWWIGRLIGFYHSTRGLHPAGFIMSLLGAVVLLALWRNLGGRRRLWRWG